MKQGPDPFYSFLKAVRGNWRNAIYLYCGRSACPYGDTSGCGGFLMAADPDGVPILMPVKAFEAFSGETVAPEECSGILHDHAFTSAYALMILWRTVSFSDCPLLALRADKPAAATSFDPNICKGGHLNEI